MKISKQVKHVSSTNLRMIDLGLKIANFCKDCYELKTQTKNLKVKFILYFALKKSNTLTRND